MLFDNPIFAGWYTDTVDIYRVVAVTCGNVTSQERKKVNEPPIPCRVYSSKRDGPVMSNTAAAERSTEKLSCDLSVDIRAGDELEVIRGGGLGIQGQPERYFAGEPQSFYDPVGGAMTQLQHKEVGLLRDNLIGSGR